MTPRFTSNLLLAVLAGFLVCASLTFGVANAGWIALGAGATALALAAVGFAALDRGAAQRRLDALVALLAAVTVVESRVFDDGVLRWTTFGLGGALCALAALGLVLHERDQQRRLAVQAASLAERRGPGRNGSAWTTAPTATTSAEVPA